MSEDISLEWVKIPLKKNSSMCENKKYSRKQNQRQKTQKLLIRSLVCPRDYASYSGVGSSKKKMNEDISEFITGSSAFHKPSVKVNNNIEDNEENEKNKEQTEEMRKREENEDASVYESHNGGGDGHQKNKKIAKKERRIKYKKNEYLLDYIDNIKNENRKSINNYEKVKNFDIETPTNMSNKKGKNNGIKNISPINNKKTSLKNDQKKNKKEEKNVNAKNVKQKTKKNDRKGNNVPKEIPIKMSPKIRRKINSCQINKKAKRKKDEKEKGNKEDEKVKKNEEIVKKVEVKNVNKEQIKLINEKEIENKDRNEEKGKNLYEEEENKNKNAGNKNINAGNKNEEKEENFNQENLYTNPVEKYLSKMKEEENDKNVEETDFNNLLEYIYKPALVGEKIKCVIIRQNKGLFPTILMYLEENDGTMWFLMAARKRKKSLRSNYIVCTDTRQLYRESPSFVGKIKANLMNTGYTVYGDGKDANKGELAGIKQNFFFLDSFGICRLTVVLPCHVPLYQRVQVKSKMDGSSFLSRLRRQKMDNLLVFHNKMPTWNPELDIYMLNFGGRVKQTSKKNFQIVHHQEKNHIIFQFGRVDENSFSMDFSYPMCPLQAFGVAVSILDKKL